MNSQEPCCKCKDTNNLLSFSNETGDFDLRFDVENKQLDFRISNLLNAADEIDESINISYCSFCGRKL